MRICGKKLLALVCIIAAAAVLGLNGSVRSRAMSALRHIKGRDTVASRVSQYGEAVRLRLEPDFVRVGMDYPPRRVTLIGLKSERLLEVWADDGNGTWRHLRDYTVIAASGTLGPKLKQGDRQVPEGVYRVESLNPNSSYHLSLRLNYPNPDDQRRAKEGGISDPGSDIMIHGSRWSVGCLAMGDEAAEDLFVLAAETGVENISVILSPVDFRTRDLPEDAPPAPAWSRELYAEIRAALAEFR